MSPIALTSEYTSPPGVPAKKSEIASANEHNGVSYEGTATPYSATSTAVSEYGEVSASKGAGTAETAQSVVDSALPQAKSTPGDADYFSALLRSSAPTPTTKAGAVVYGSAIQVLEAFAIQQAGSVWVYDDAAQVGFGAGALQYAEEAGDNKAGDKVHAVQARPGAGLELAGYSAQVQSKGTLAVFASTSTLDLLLPSLEAIKGDVVIHLATTAASDDALEIVDTLLAPGIVKALTRLPEDWTVVFSSGRTAVVDAGKIYGNGGKVIHVVESTHTGREVSSYTFPAPSSAELDFDFSGSNADKDITVVPAGSTAPVSGAVLSLKTLSPSAEKLAGVLAGEGKTVSVLGGTKADADALKAVVLSALYSASGSSSQVLPAVKSIVAAPATSTQQAVEGGKTVAFYTAPTSHLPELVAHLFLSSPSLETRLATFGSSAARGTKSLLSLTPSSAQAAPLSVNGQVDVAWVNDANVLKATDVLASLAPGGILVLQLPWTEDEVPVKLTRPELIAIKEKGIRVFLLDLAPCTPSLAIRETAAFLLLYTGAPILPQGVRKVLDAFYGGDVSREDVEEPQAGLSELPAASWEVPELEEGKTDKVKPQWEWDALAGEAGLIDVSTEAKPSLAQWDAVARHLLFREAFAVEDAKAKLLDTVPDVPALAALRPSTPDETFIVTVSENRRLTPPSYDRNVFHLELDTAGTGLKYEIGEAIGIHGWNDTAEILDFCGWYGLDPDSLVSFPNPEQAGTVETRTVFQLLQQNVDLFGRPGKAFYAALSKIATSRAEQMTLKFISAPEGAELFKKLAEAETVTYADILYRYRTARPSIEELVGLVPEIKPRHYSIASSQKAVGDKVELLIVTVDWINSKGSPRFGQCTRYLAALAPGSKVTVSIKPSVMKLPPDDKQPIIMAGLGTGAAPFRAFMQHRAWQRSQGVEVGPLLYYFGSRYRSQEYLYGEEIEAYIASGIISHAGLAFSRDGKDKMYIQHKMSQDKELLAKLLLGKDSDAAYFYLCGPTWPVPDVFEALVGALTENGGMDRKGAEEYIEELKEEERYVLEVY